MSKPTITPVCAFDIAANGTAQAVTDDWPDIEPVDGGYRWLHFNRTEAEFEAWANALPLMQATPHAPSAASSPPSHSD